jgi:hypothetical protein
MLLRDIHLVDVHAVREPALVVGDGDVVPAHLALAHEAVGGERPVLEPVGPPPLPGGVVPLVPELHGDLVRREREQLLAQAVPLLALPLLRQEGLDRVAARQEGVPVAPDRVRRVGELYFGWVSICALGGVVGDDGRVRRRFGDWVF